MFPDNESFIKRTVNRSMVCPHCSEKMTPTLLSITPYNDNQKYVATLYCSDCKYPIVKLFAKVWFSDNVNEITLEYNKSIVVDLPKNIEKLSPDFVTNYQQTLLAKEYELTELVGMGYRKSAESLIKDFVIKTNRGETDKVSKMLLKPVIEEYLKDNDKLYTMSLACAYLGNDYSHYERRNLDKDIQDLERFIAVLISYISYELTLHEANDFIQ
ncbi:hypothetical protein SM120_11505 [Lactococcus lactis subsp. lactis]|uniref:hypothetical protein n=1 Tax=Lactococcus lactis TaxID=1358 RepID=UPI002A8126CA|nr:hypothetical protein [Lactococcus lactis]MDY4364256.1 hypothetical protein [Lactococcus lactis subsp. lactis]